MAQPITELGDGGINLDSPPFILPPNVFSDALNVRFDDDSVSTTTGEIASRVVSIAPTYGIHWRRPDQGYNIFANESGVIHRYTASGTSSVMYTGAGPYVGGRWQGTLFNGGFAVVLNNGQSTPLYCLYGDPSADTVFIALPGWNYVGGLTVTAKVIRSLNYSLVAANLTLVDGAVTTYAPSTIRVSAQAATGNIPTVWLPGTTTDTADEFEISTTSPILDMLELRGSMFIYSSDSISIMTVSSAGTKIQPYSKSYGILNIDCVVEFDGNHLVVDRNDIYLHNGSGAITSIAQKRVKKWFFANLNKSYINKVQVIKNPQYKEIWICFPMGSSTVNNMALVFQYTTKTWTKRTLASVTYAFNGPSNASNAWQYGNERVYMTTNSTQTLITDDVYTMYTGSIITSFTNYVERKKISSGDDSKVTAISSFLPVFDRVPTDSSISITVVGQHNYTKDVDLSVDNGIVSDTFVFLPNDPGGQGYKVDPRTGGRLLNFRISAKSYWRLAQYSIEAQQTSRR